MNGYYKHQLQRIPYGGHGLQDAQGQTLARLQASLQGDLDDSARFESELWTVTHTLRACSAASHVSCSGTARCGGKG